MTKPRTYGLFAFAPAGSRIGKLNLSKMVCIGFVFCATTAIASQARTFTSLLSFDGTNGGRPSYMSLVQGSQWELLRDNHRWRN